MKKKDQPFRSFFSVLTSIAKDKQSGVLDLKLKSGKRRIFFHKGLLKMIAIPGAPHPLQRALYEQRLLKERVVKKLKRKMDGKIEPEAIMEELGLDKSQVMDKIKALLEKEFYTVLLTSVEEFRFREGEIAYGRGIDELEAWVQTICIEPLIVLPMRKGKEWDLLESILPSPLDVYFVSPGSPFDVEEGVEENGKEKEKERGGDFELMKLVNGERDVDEISALSGMGNFETRHKLYRLEVEDKIRRATEGELVYLAVDFQNKGRIDKCLRLYKRAEDLGSEIFDLPLTIGRQYESIGLKDEAINRYFQFAHRCREKGLTDRAISAYRRVLYLDEGNLDGRENVFQLLLVHGIPQEVRKEGMILAKHYLEGKNTEKAVKVFEGIVERGGGDAEVFQSLVMALKERGEKEVWQRCHRLAEKLDKEEQRDHAGALLAVFLQEYPYHRDARRLLAENLVAQREKTHAFEQYEELVRQAREAKEGEDTVLDGELAELYRTMTDLDSGFSEGHQLLAEWHLSKEQKERAIHHLKELKRIYQESENMRRLTDVMEELTNLLSEDVTLRGELADIYISTGKLEQGIDTYLSIVDLNFEQSQRREAERLLRKVLILSPMNIRANRALAEFYMKEGLFVEVKDFLERIALASRGKELWKEAAWAFAELARLHPEESYYLRGLVEACYRGGDPARGRQIMEEMAKKNVEQENFGIVQEICGALLKEDPGNAEAKVLLNQASLRESALPQSHSEDDACPVCQDEEVGKSLSLGTSSEAATPAVNESKMEPTKETEEEDAVSEVRWPEQPPVSLMEKDEQSESPEEKAEEDGLASDLPEEEAEEEEELSAQEEESDMLERAAETDEEEEEDEREEEADVEPVFEFEEESSPSKKKKRKKLETVAAGSRKHSKSGQDPVADAQNEGNFHDIVSKLKNFKKGKDKQAD